MDKENKNESYIHIDDISCHATWKKVPSMYLHITGLYIGKVKVATYCIDGINTKGGSKVYVVNSPLPTIKGTIGRYETEEECRKVCLQVAKVFCKQLKGDD